MTWWGSRWWRTRLRWRMLRWRRRTWWGSSTCLRVCAISFVRTCLPCVASRSIPLPLNPFTLAKPNLPLLLLTLNDSGLSLLSTIQLVSKLGGLHHVTKTAPPDLDPVGHGEPSLDGILLQSRENPLVIRRVNGHLTSNARSSGCLTAHSELLILLGLVSVLVFVRSAVSFSVSAPLVAVELGLASSSSAVGFRGAMIESGTMSVGGAGRRPGRCGIRAHRGGQEGKCRRTSIDSHPASMEGGGGGGGGVVEDAAFKHSSLG